LAVRMILQEIDALSYEDREIVAQVMAEAVPLMTERQRDCLTLYMDGMTQEEVGAELGIAHNTVHYHLAAALRKVAEIAQDIDNCPRKLRYVYRRRRH